MKLREEFIMRKVEQVYENIANGEIIYRRFIESSKEGFLNAAVENRYEDIPIPNCDIRNSFEREEKRTGVRVDADLSVAAPVSGVYFDVNERDLIQIDGVDYRITRISRSLDILFYLKRLE